MNTREATNAGNRHDALRERFVSLCGGLGDGRADVKRGWADVLLGLYGGPDRHYHSTAHIADLLARLDDPKMMLTDPRGYRLEIEFAIWFHDAIYAVPNDGNEAASAALAVAFLRSVGVPVNDRDVTENRLVKREPGFAGRVFDAILATRHDGKNVDGPAAQIMVDLDLAGFADPWETFDAKNALIRKEYTIYDDDTYRFGRAKFLAGLLTRPKIFHVLTDHEAPARANIKRHLRELVG